MAFYLTKRVQKNRDVPFGEKTMKQWLKNAKAAELLIVSERTIKRWMTRPAARGALGAVRYGKQWRIPLLNDGSTWEIHADHRLRTAGVLLKPLWQRDLEKRGKEFARCELESYRLWLAAHSQLLERERITEEDVKAVLLLWQSACEILDSLPKGTEVDKLKPNFSDQLRARNFSEDRIRFIMSYWPKQKHFKLVRDAHTSEQLEKIRRRVDTAQAVKMCKNLGKKPTAENLRPLLHKDIMKHLNDTWEKLPGIVVKNPTEEEMRHITMASVQDEIMGKPPTLVTFDLRQPQNGLALRTVRNRHPLKKSPQKEIIAAVYDVQNSIPGVDERPHSGKTPIRDSKLSKNSD